MRFAANILFYLRRGYGLRVSIHKARNTLSGSNFSFAWWFMHYSKYWLIKRIYMAIRARFF